MEPERIDRIRRAFEANFASGREVGAALSIWSGGREEVHFCGGFRDAARTVPWTPETLVLIWSATKGIAAACALRVIESFGCDLEMPVARLWPEFSGGGKAGVTLGQVLSHQAGLAALGVQGLDVLDHESVVRAIETQPPLWDVGHGHGYGPRTFGFLVDEIVRRATGEVSLGAYWRSELADPLALDLWIGLPESEFPRVATMLPPRAEDLRGGDPFFEAFADPGSLTRRAFSSPGGLASVSSMNSPAARSASLPGMGGIGTASSLAKFYAILAEGGRWNGKSHWGDSAMGWMSNRLTQGPDKVLLTDTAFSAGFLMDPLDAFGNKLRAILGPSPGAFGHPGAGGSLAFADPANRIGFAYVMNRMEPGALPGERALSLVRALYDPL